MEELVSGYEAREESGNKTILGHINMSVYYDSDMAMYKQVQYICMLQRPRHSNIQID